MNSSLKSIASNKKNFVCKHTGEELLLIPLRDNVADFNQYLVMNELAAFIWDELDEDTSFADLQKRIFAEFDVTPEQLHTDLEIFIPELYRYTHPA